MLRTIGVLRAARRDQTFRADLIDRCGAAARAGLIDRSRAGSDIAGARARAAIAARPDAPGLVVETYTPLRDLRQSGW